MAYRKLAVVGGGAKAAAICAKAACLRDAADIDIRVTVFERAELGAHWSGDHGYTDGEQRLCTPAERDAGFPYPVATFGEAIAEITQARFSWAAYAVAFKHYPIWVDQGRSPPSHKRFAEYIDFCISSSNADVVEGEVKRVARSENGWAIDYMPKMGGPAGTEDGFDGVVMTGPGPARSRLKTVSDPRIYDGVSFWQNLESVLALANGTPTVPIVIIGSGGTAAAIAGWMVRARVANELIILGRQPALYARAESFFENRMFSSPAVWDALSDDDRIAFTERLTRGAVWSNVLDELSCASNVTYFPGKASGVRHEPRSDPNGVLWVEFATSRSAAESGRPACLVVDATGFNPVWFSSLFDPVLRPELQIDENKLRSGMDGSLRLDLTVGRSIHAPMLSQVISPGYTSLMGLGAMADAILEPYVSQLV